MDQFMFMLHSQEVKHTSTPFRPYCPFMIVFINKHRSLTLKKIPAASSLILLQTLSLITLVLFSEHK